MNLQIEARKVLDWILTQPIVIRIILLFAVLVFIVIPFGVPFAIIYFVYSVFKSRQHGP
jgi:hypothetical protein